MQSDGHRGQSEIHQNMIEIINPGFLSLLVDGGRFGFGGIGVPSSSALDRYAFRMANYLLKNRPEVPVVEVIGSGFAVTAHGEVWCAITGARVSAAVDGDRVLPWTSFRIPAGGRLTVEEVTEGFRYYIGFSGMPAVGEVLGSRSTNLECRFGGFKGRPFMRGDFLELKDIRPCRASFLPEEKVPTMAPPHLLRIVGGPELNYFTPESRAKALSGEEGEGFVVSSRLNRTAIRLEGNPLVFERETRKSIISEGLLPGTIQVPGDGLPMITLYERTIGGYARLGVVAAADRDLLAHLKPGDRVRLKLITPEDAGKPTRPPVLRYI